MKGVGQKLKVGDFLLLFFNSNDYSFLITQLTYVSLVPKVKHWIWTQYTFTIFSFWTLIC